MQKYVHVNNTSTKPDTIPSSIGVILNSKDKHCTMIVVKQLARPYAMAAQDLVLRIYVTIPSRPFDFDCHKTQERHESLFPLKLCSSIRKSHTIAYLK